MICKVCGETTDGENANYCMYCGSRLKGVPTHQKLVVMQEIEMSQEELQKLIHRTKF